MKTREDIEQTITVEMTRVYDDNVNDPRQAIHLSALAGAVICAVLPVGVDAWALRLCEIIMIICIASTYGERLDKAAARGLLASSFAQLVGERVALAALEAANAAHILTPAAAYAIKASIAVALIEAVGHAAMNHYAQKIAAPGPQRTAFDAICVAGAAADIARAAHVVEGIHGQANPQDLCGGSNPGADAGKAVSFQGGLGASEMMKLRANSLKNDAAALEWEARNIERTDPVAANRKREQARQQLAEVKRIMKQLDAKK